MAKRSDKDFSIALATGLGRLIRAKFGSFEAASGPCRVSPGLLSRYANAEKPQQMMPEKLPLIARGLGVTVDAILPKEDPDSGGWIAADVGALDAAKRANGADEPVEAPREPHDVYVYEVSGRNRWRAEDFAALSEEKLRALFPDGIGGRVDAIDARASPNRRTNH